MKNQVTEIQENFSLYHYVLDYLLNFTPLIISLIFLYLMIKFYMKAMKCMDKYLNS